MDAVRVRRGFSVEVIAVAAFLLATVAVGSLIVRELRTVRAPAPAQLEEGALTPTGVPAQGISVPALLLLDGKALRVGDDGEQVTVLLGEKAQQGPETLERGPIGRRVTRSYEHAGTRFVLVLEPFEPNGRLRVAGIYIQ